MQVALTLATLASSSLPLDRAKRPQGLGSLRAEYSLWDTIQVSVEQATASLVQEWRVATLRA